MRIHFNKFFMHSNEAIIVSLLNILMSVIPGGSEFLLGRGAFIPNEARRVTWPNGSPLAFLCLPEYR